MKCQTKGCKNKAAKYRKICHGCKHRAWRKKNPLKASYLDLKKRDKARGKDFSLTFEEYKKFAIETGYDKGKGKTVGSYHIDRIDETQGYHVWNIQKLEATKNIRKYIVWKQGEGLKTETQTKINFDEDEVPF